MAETGIAVIGSTTIDQIIDQKRSVRKAGGVTVYSGITYSRHGIRTLAITRIANKDPQIVERLHCEGILVRNGQTPRTTHFINSIRSGDRTQKNPQRAAPISRKQIIENVEDVGFLHLGPLHPADIAIQAIKSVKDLKLDVILDIQGLVRAVKGEKVYPAASQPLRDALSVSQIVKANRHEYEIMIDFFQTDLAALMRQFNIREFIVTSGTGGGFVKEATGAAIPYAAAAARFRGDSTGAGDIFLAAYVVRHLFNRQPIPDACRYAARLAARQIDDNYIKEDDLRL